MTFMKFAGGVAVLLVLSLQALGQAAVPPAPAETTSPASNKTAPPNGKTKSASDGPSKTAPKRHKRTPPPPDGALRKVIVREGGATEPTAQIVPGIPPEEAARQRQSAEQLLGFTDLQLKPLAERTLDAQQSETLGQIRNYITGARSALQEGDVRRASTLAEKAHLLADDLIKQ
jgi:hypothetical protein